MNNKPVPPAVASFVAGERQQLINRVAELEREVAALKAQPGGVVLPERKGREYKDWRDWSLEDIGYNKALDEVARLNQQPASGGDDAERAALATLERFVETVRECYHLASSYSGSLDSVDEHGGDDHEDPICAVFHRLYYAMFDGEKGLEQARAALAQSERVAASVGPDDVRGACQDAIEVFAEQPDADQCREVAEYMREVLLAIIARREQGAAPSPSKQGGE